MQNLQVTRWQLKGDLGLLRQGGRKPQKTIGVKLGMVILCPQLKQFTTRLISLKYLNNTNNDQEMIFH